MSARLTPVAYAALRIMAGLMFALHGVQKILHFPPGGSGPAVGSQIWVGGIIELVGGTLIAVGLFTRIAAFLASGTMAVAYFQFHWKLVFSNWKFLPGENKGEMAALYCFVFLFIAAQGGGSYALDKKR
jgi:putative oxidoreductase